MEVFGLHHVDFQQPVPLRRGRWRGVGRGIDQARVRQEPQRDVGRQFSGGLGEVLAAFHHQRAAAVGQRIAVMAVAHDARARELVLRHHQVHERRADGGGQRGIAVHLVVDPEGLYGRAGRVDVQHEVSGVQHRAQFAGAAQAFIDAEAAVQARVVDIALPADGGAGLFKIDAHDDQQVFLVLVHGGAQLAGVFHRLPMVVDRAGADHDQKAVIAAMQHVGDLRAAVFDQRLDGGGNGQFVLEQRGRNQRTHCTDARVVGARVVLGRVGRTDLAVVLGVVNAGQGRLRAVDA
ncbi:hypothetical protein G6F22_016610 [Rhizopus arrhizus]|nr:hypothetical protein G6F22_016610 [Rhizopus arrhizus]